jgi:phosphate transport system substrate-binding protein
MKKMTKTILLTASMLVSMLHLSCAYADTIKIGGTGAGLAILRSLADAYVKTHPDSTFVVLPSLGSSGGIRAVAGGAVQLAVSSRALKGAEKDQGLVAVELGKTPFVFAVSTRNSIQNITLAQLADIYAGRTDAWPNGQKIRIVLRPTTDADSKLVRSISPAMARAKHQAEQRPGMLFAYTDQDNQDNLEKIPGALGATSLGQILAEQRQLKALTLDGVRPSVQNLANGSYHYAKTLYLVTAPSSPPTAHDFVTFVRTPPARQILAQAAYWTP